ncbi:cytochrome c oxidase assembly factor Coa1 family protein [uncultured Winogradskyella sp.]|uniref:cytochrome c oxidase assembly factor Coa1 family protein n=1 Tax=uncultured Winogradskyella sp. TaxID=395353 RepID=UPI00261BF890|nr:cytochrome c oxidase assembly factor Coa1 family protein [uncultured Winogradskyella sp.]
MEEYRKKSWFSRNWGWVLGGGCLTIIVLLVVFVGSIFFGVTKMFTSSTPYKYAMEQATTNENIIALIGEPIEKDGMLQGNISLNGDDGEADFKIPIKGPKGEARIVVVAKKDYGKWVYEKLYVQIKDSQKQINLMEEKLEGI